MTESKQYDRNIWALEETGVLENLAALRSSADASARHLSGLYFTFLLFAFYVAVVVFSTTDAQLLKESGLRMALLNVDLPLKGFYVVVPWLVWLFHFYLLIQFYFLSRKLFLLEMGNTRLPKAVLRIHRILPFPLLFSHMLIGHHYSRDVQLALRVIVLITIVILPVLLLLGIQLQFLPYHSIWITFNHQLVLLADIAVLWGTWPRLLSPRGYRLCPSPGITAILNMEFIEGFRVCFRRF